MQIIGDEETLGCGRKERERCDPGKTSLLNAPVGARFDHLGGQTGKAANGDGEGVEPDEQGSDEGPPSSPVASLFSPTVLCIPTLLRCVPSVPSRGA